MPRPHLPLATVVEQFNVSRSTLRRGITSGRFPGAHTDSNGRWLIPVNDLVAAGLTARRTWLTAPGQGVATEVATGGHQGGHEHGHEHPNPATSASDQVATEHGHGGSQGGHEHAHLEQELATERARADHLADLLAAERQHTDSLKMALRMIEQTRPPVAAEPPALDRRRWWQRRR